jgi:hypothetical protein
MAVWMGAGVLAVAAGVSGASSPATAQLNADTAVAFTCPFSSGTLPVDVRVAVSLPETAAVDRQIQPTGIGLSFQVPAAAVAGLPGAGSAPLRASAQLNVTPTLAGIGVRTVWTFPGTQLVAPATAGTAAPAMKAAGTTPPVSSAIPGRLAFLATRLTLTFSSAEAKDEQVVCTTADDSGTLLASVSVTQSQSPVGDGRVRANRNPLTAGPNAGSASATDITPADDNFQFASAYLIGYSNVKKLNGATLVGPGLVNLKIFFPVQDPVTGDYTIYTEGSLVFPASTSTFLTFGFMPTTATMQLTQVGLMTINSTSHLEGDTYINTNVSTVQMSLQLSDLKVNGTLLKVGPNCRTAQNLELKLASEGDYNAGGGGTFSGSITIPPFAGCGVGEDLDPLLTASISGPGNVVRITQGLGCFAEPPPPYQCPPTIPVPQR